jgi:hypothetical protein
MALLKFKNTVIVPRTTIIAAAVVNAANVLALPVDMLVTSGNDSKHMKGSKHYKDEALDFRTKHLSKAAKHALVAEVKKRLGSAFDVILEDEGNVGEHMHVEYDPK